MFTEGGEEAPFKGNRTRKEQNQNIGGKNLHAFGNVSVTKNGRISLNKKMNPNKNPPWIHIHETLGQLD